MIPNRYQVSSGNLVNYNYADIASGTGYKIYYGYNEKISGSAYYKLTTDPIFSYDIESSGSSGTDTTLIKDIDFDILFNKPQNIKGAVKFNFGYTVLTGGTPFTWITARVRKWNGTTETTLASVTTPVVQSATNPKVFCMSATVPLTHYKVGETFRITIELYGYSNPACDHVFFHDPMNRNSCGVTVGTTIGTTKFEVHVPFVMDL